MKTLLDILLVPRCICCSEILPRGSSDGPFCPICLSRWEQQVNACRLSAHGQPVKEYKSGDGSGELRSVLYLVKYLPGKKQRVENTFILKLKDYSLRSTVRFAAGLMVGTVRAEAPFLFEDGGREKTVITFIPRRAISLWSRGFDHMQRVAKEMSRLTSLPYKRLIKRRLFSYEQKSLSYRERMLNAEKSMRLTNAAGLNGKTVILIDDIVTSGASMDVAASLFYKAGASQVISIALAATDRDSDGAAKVNEVFNIIKKPKGGKFKKQ